MNKNDIDQLINEQGNQTLEVISLQNDRPDKAAQRATFLSEHCHSDKEVRFFVTNQDLFSLHLNGKVYEALCQQSSLISAPANTPHWFDMRPEPSSIAMRRFNTPNGWTAHYTGSEIADHFNRMENAA